MCSIWTAYIRIVSSSVITTAGVFLLLVAVLLITISFKGEFANLESETAG